MMIFYRAIVESILRYGISSWFGNLTMKLKSKLAGMHKTAMKIVGRKEYEPTQRIYEQAVRKKAKKIISNSPNTHSSLNMKPCHQGEDSVCRYANLTALNYHLSQPPLS